MISGASVAEAGRASDARAARSHALVFLAYVAVTIVVHLAAGDRARRGSALPTWTRTGTSGRWRGSTINCCATRVHLFDSNMYLPVDEEPRLCREPDPTGAAGGADPRARRLAAARLQRRLAVERSRCRPSAPTCSPRSSADRARRAFLAGLGFGFCTYRWDHIVHIQSLSTQWLPLALAVPAARAALQRARATCSGWACSRSLSC